MNSRSCLISMNWITPTSCLIPITAVTAAAGVWAALVRRARSREVRRMAHRWGMNFQAADNLQLARRIFPHLPVFGAADVTVSDVAYRRAATRYEFIFTLAYTIGASGRLTRLERAAGFSEALGRGAPVLHDALILASPGESELREQYESVAQAMGLMTDERAADHRRNDE
jgi:hypothetical protein